MELLHAPNAGAEGLGLFARKLKLKLKPPRPQSAPAVKKNNKKYSNWTGLEKPVTAVFELERIVSCARAAEVSVRL